MEGLAERGCCRVWITSSSRTPSPADERLYYSVSRFDADMKTGERAAHIETVAAVGDPLRRSLYDYVAAQPEPVSRNMGAAAVGGPGRWRHSIRSVFCGMAYRRPLSIGWAVRWSDSYSGGPLRTSADNSPCDCESSWV